MKLTLEFDCDNAAFDDDLALEVSRILSETAEKIVQNQREGVCRDINGNRVGQWELANRDD